MNKLLAAGAVCLALVTAPVQALDPASPEARAADIAAFRTGFFTLDRSFSPQARTEAETRLAALEANRSDVSQAYFDIELARIAALADNGHTGIHPGRRARPYDRVPVRLAPFGEDFYVLRAKTAHAGLLGARLVAINNHPIAELRAAARTLVGGTSARRDRWAPFFLESPAQMHALRLAANAGRATYVFERPNGARARIELVAEPAPEHGSNNAARWLLPEMIREEGDAWRALLAPAQTPWSLRAPDDRFRLRDAPEIDAFVIELRQNHDAPTMEIASFAYAAEDAVRAAGRRHIVLDMRMNGGGDLNTTRAFMRRLPALAPGRIFVLTSPWTFSAAISSTGYLEQAAPDRVTIVGEHIGDRLEFWAEGDGVRLPNSGALALFSTERHDYKTGCRPFTDCHGSVVRHPIAVPTLAPDIAAPWTIEAYRAGRDPAMEAVARAVGAPANQ
jgi:hypothetical protein